MARLAATASGHEGIAMGLLLIVNTGSSSVRYDVFDVDSPSGAAEPRHRRIAGGHVEEIGGAGGHVEHHVDGQEAVERDEDVADHSAALDLMLSMIDEHGPDVTDLSAVGHRVVHGGDTYDDATLIDDEVESAIDSLSRFAPLHNPPALAGIRTLRERQPDVPQYAVFDTAFHRTIPDVAATYAIPAELTEAGVKRYGFHGTSHRYVTHRAAEHLGLAVDVVRLIVCHIGNGVSVTAIRDGRSVDTSMGLTPLEGAVMGTRSGDLDPAVVTMVMRERRLDPDEVEHLLNKQSGLKGMCGESDMREVRRLAGTGDERARLALDVYARRLRGYIGTYVAHVPELHALVFTAGVGENDAAMRADIVSPLEHLGFTLDPERNEGAIEPSEVTRIDDDSAGPAVLVVPTDEGLEMAIEISAQLPT